MSTAMAWLRAALLGAAPALVASAAQAAPTADSLLAADAPPPGVVFEVVTGERTALDRVLPEIARDVERIRTRFPGLRIAVVTHGVEQFSLLEEKREKHVALHELVRALSGERDVPVHVCGNHASWRNKAPSDFPAYVDVAASAGTRLARLRSRGFVVIVK